MSARFLQSPDSTNCDTHRALNAALLVALAVNPPIRDFSALHDDPRHDARAEAPPHRRQCSAGNSVGLLHAREEYQGESTFVPSVLGFVNPDLIVDRDAVHKIMNALSEGLSDSEIQKLIDRCFPANDFREHLISHLRVFLAGKPFLSVVTPRDRSWLMRKLKGTPSESVEILDVESTVALKHIENAQRWFGAHFRTIAHIMHTSLGFDFQLQGIRRDGTFIRKPDTTLERNPVYFALTAAEIKELYDMSGHFKKAARQLVAKTDALEAKLDSKSRKMLSEYLKSLNVKWVDELIPPLRVKRRLYSIQWMLGFGPPIFFANHRNEFAEVMDLLTQYRGITNGLSTQLLKNLRFLGKAMRDFCAHPGDLKPLEEHCKILVAHKHWLATNEPL
eukprot:Blabericola_migrator_1__905@NODE_1223_length_5062_cov_15_623223_g830_i0_p2_GENE_NODE_1223_length_5062_cov_15_623223_g830_i0NODE_1223_length_5062_cov_15_623223_g830_i0_p2_ORF_typecomplete_len391_score55_04CODH_A_N/PF18537_1/0_34_NODE_1223_length_5062_cov_15_623223_g830_i038204992